MGCPDLDEVRLFGGEWASIMNFVLEQGKPRTIEKQECTLQNGRLPSARSLTTYGSTTKERKMYFGSP